MILNCPKFETCEPCERRADPRIECHLPCVLEQEGRSSQSIVVANLSGGGAMIRGHFGLMPRGIREIFRVRGVVLLTLIARRCATLAQRLVP